MERRGLVEVPGEERDPGVNGAKGITAERVGMMVVRM